MGHFAAEWPEKGLTVHAFVSSLNNGGYVLVEADDANVVYCAASSRDDIVLT